MFLLLPCTTVTAFTFTCPSAKTFVQKKGGVYGWRWDSTDARFQEMKQLGLAWATAKSRIFNPSDTSFSPSYPLHETYRESRKGLFDQYAIGEMTCDYNSGTLILHYYWLDFPDVFQLLTPWKPVKGYHPELHGYPDPDNPSSYDSATCDTTVGEPETCSFDTEAMFCYPGSPFENDKKKCPSPS